MDSHIENQSAYKPMNYQKEKFMTDHTPIKNSIFAHNSNNLNSERVETDEVILRTATIDEDTDLKLELLRREMKMQRDMKSQITMFNAGKLSS
jgi:hypothetical protein